jgi:hypothetical protein
MDVIKGASPTLVFSNTFLITDFVVDPVCSLSHAAVQFYVDKIVGDTKIDGMKALLLDDETVRWRS